MLRLDNCKPGKSYNNITYLDDIFFKANDGEIQRLSKFMTAKPDDKGFLKLVFYCSEAGTDEDIIFTCKWDGVCDSGGLKQKKIKQMQVEVKKIFDKAEIFIHEYFG
jgi:hypothetical protein